MDSSASRSRRPSTTGRHTDASSPRRAPGTSSCGVQSATVRREQQPQLSGREHDVVPGQPEPFTPGRNYWHDANNQLDGYTFAQDNPLPARGNRLRDDDPRLVTLFFTPYDSFAASGNEVFPIVAFGNFYITGYGRTVAGGASVAGRGARRSVHRRKCPRPAQRASIRRRQRTPAGPRSDGWRHVGLGALRRRREAECRSPAAGPASSATRVRASSRASQFWSNESSTSPRDATLM